jgi:cytochrome oxidase Cu insertion factor (SCO1/SenC/PrrC family)
MRIPRIAVAVVICLAAIGWAAERPESTAPTPSFKVGEMAPDFTLKDQTGKQVSLHDFRGKQNVALAFYVFAFSPT